MKLRLSSESIRRAASAALAAFILTGVVATAAPAMAAPQSPPNFDRAAVIKRAKGWTTARVPYSQVRFRGGYRTDCSGFISMAWNIPANLVTWLVPTVAKPIAKNDLMRGDVLLNPRGDRHVVMFEKWANAQHTKYWVLEETGQNGVDSAIRRVVPYPYRFQGSMYKPYRYVGMGGYYNSVRPADRQLVAGYGPSPKKWAPAPKPAKPAAPTSTPAPKPAPKPASTPRPAPAPKAAEPLVDSGFLGALVGWLTGR